LHTHDCHRHCRHTARRCYCKTRTDSGRTDRRTLRQFRTISCMPGRVAGPLSSEPASLSPALGKIR
jgi:hypothetical protein